MKQLKFLGRGSAFNIKDGNTAAYIKDNNTLLLIDCGETVFKEIQRRNLLEGVSDINILITHLHSDHVGSLSSLLMYCYYIKKIKAKVFYPGETAITKLLLLNGNIEGITYEYKVLESIPSLNIYISSFISQHCNELISFGYLISSEENIIYYSGDSKEVNYIALYDIINSNNRILYQDTCLADSKDNVHLSLRELCELVPTEARHKVYCMHLDCEELAIKAKEEGFNVVEV